MGERRGSIRQRGTDSWQLRVYRGVDPATGKQRYATRTVHGSRRTAQRQLAALVAEVDNAATPEGTLAELLERWSAAASPEWKPSTQATVLWATTCHLVPHLGHLPVAKLTAVDIDDFYAFLLRRGGPKGCGLAVDTVRRVHGVLHQAMAQALLWDWIWINPAAGVSPPRTRKSEIRPSVWELDVTWPGPGIQRVHDLSQPLEVERARRPRASPSRGSCECEGHEAR